MPVDFSDILVIGVSSRALFDLEQENDVFQKEGIEAFQVQMCKNHSMQ